MATPKLIIQKATAFQIKPGSRYIVKVSDLEMDDADRLQQWFKDAGVDNVLIVTAETLDISEVPQNS